MIETTPYHINFLDASSGDGHHEHASDRWPVESLSQGNAISSEVLGKPGRHAVLLDIDYDADLVPSSTFGHYHLYLGVEMSWEQYARLLTVLAEVGVIEPGYASAAIERGATFVRKPGVLKDTRPHEENNL